MKRNTETKKSAPTGPSQRQLRAGELIRHALVDVFREEGLADPVLVNVSITVSEVRMSPDLRHAVCFVEPLGSGLRGEAGRKDEDIAEVIKALNRGASFLRGRLGKVIDMKFTPDLKFIHDESFGAAAHMDRLFDDPRVQQDTGRLSDVLGEDDDLGDEA
ncbi:MULTISPECIES: 30S ribosome-binding factor RbfA [unclassified Caulobacter]|uniref:30S ribosome-binding factor RbfA n=1 Tax=unclassified Caulobacter TaxID=2648921 RepID=UPI0006FD845E|nr:MULTISPECIES: 30S ribosome-binding factor RbfA [unclassified Caulobacter]KQV62232.1 ribosome-binding factor A [Caulobacter sp. Root342]KQV63152.1 ribosome-binding factor A [Caulobacter sp. Root343]